MRENIHRFRKCCTVSSGKGIWTYKHGNWSALPLGGEFLIRFGTLRLVFKRKQAPTNALGFVVGHSLTCSAAQTTEFNLVSNYSVATQEQAYYCYCSCNCHLFACGCLETPGKTQTRNLRKGLLALALAYFILHSASPANIHLICNQRIET